MKNLPCSRFAHLPLSLIGICLLLALCSSLSAQDRGLAVVAKSVAGDDIKIGRQYAVLIAIDKYQEWNPLRNPVKDAKAIKEILQRRYFIDEVIELYNEDATSSGIRRLFSSLIDKVQPTDSVLIYYAGHGYLDKFNTGFWIAVDGSKDIDAQMGWVANSQIRNFVGLMKARSIALISDSCFSGDLLNVSRSATPTIDSAYYKNALRYTARQVLTSGASETVPDESEFARQFKAILESNTETCLDPLAMYDRIRRGVSETLPLLGTLPGHEMGGSFVLFLRESKIAKVPEVPPAVEVKKPMQVQPNAFLMEQIQKEQNQLASLRVSYDKSVEIKQAKKTWGITSILTGGISGIAAGAFYLLGNVAMSAYQNAPTIEDAISKRATLDLYSGLFLASASVSGIGLGVGGFLFATMPNPAKIEAQVQKSMDRLRELEAQNAAKGNE